MRPPVSLVLLLISLTPAAAREVPRTSLPTGFVYLRDVAPGSAQDIRYATPGNFTGRPLPGYAAGECVLLRPVAAALARVQAELAGQHLGLKVYDCYRPARAVAAMWHWSQDARLGGDPRFYPNIPKSELFARGYISSHSRHATGVAVDLTLVALPPRTHLDAPVGCTAPAPRAANEYDKVPDMGTGFDCLDERSFTQSRAVTRAQRDWRNVLKTAMTRAGFRNYFREWWHYEYTAAPQRTYDFPIERR
jgi:D-alanyl-D-alanine dipeptidase